MMSCKWIRKITMSPKKSSKRIPYNSNSTKTAGTLKIFQLWSQFKVKLKWLKLFFASFKDNDFFERLCPYIRSWMPFKNNESYAEANTIDHSYHLNLWPSVMNLTSMKMSATTKSYLMLLVLLLISNMAGKKFIVLFLL